jgi:hypothetical protein
METLLLTLMRQLVPEDILRFFDVEKIDDKHSDEIKIYLIEKESLVPKSDNELVLNGFLNSLELSHFPSKGRKCYLVLKRRRWKEKGSRSNMNYFNNYDFTVEGTKATKEFAAFLKENS